MTTPDIERPDLPKSAPEPEKLFFTEAILSEADSLNKNIEPTGLKTIIEIKNIRDTSKSEISEIKRDLELFLDRYTTHLNSPLKKLMEDQQVLANRINEIINQYGESLGLDALMKEDIITEVNDLYHTYKNTKEHIKKEIDRLKRVTQEDE